MMELFFLVRLALFLAWFIAAPGASASDTPMAVAFRCEKPSLFLTVDGWIQDPSQPCLHTEPDVMEYCRKIYRGANIVHATFSPVVKVKIERWCSVNASAGCLLTENETYSIQPWICSAMTQRILRSKIPSSCRLLQLEGATTSVCQKESSWLSLANVRCHKIHKIQYTKPCIRPEDYTHLHFLGADLVCCDAETYDEPNAFEHNLGITEKQNVTGATEDLVYQQYLGILPVAVDKLFERNQFTAAKAALDESVRRKRKLLEQHLIEAESHLSDEDWLTKPELTQASESAAHKKFRQQYVKLMEEARATGRRLDAVHQQRVMELLKSHEQKAALAWSSAISDRQANLTHIMKVAEHFINVMQRSRHHLIRRFEHLRSVDPMSSRGALQELKRSLADLNRTIEYNLAKLEQVPSFKLVILKFVTNLINTRYSELNSFARSISSLEEELDLSPCHNEYVLQAEQIIEKHRRHISPLDIEKLSRVIKKSDSPVHLPFAKVMDTSNSHRDGHANQHQSNLLTDPTDISRSLSSGSWTVLEEENGNHSAHVAPPKINVSSAQNVSSTIPRRPTSTPYVLIFLSILFCLGLTIFTVFVCHVRLRRMRLRRAGYTPTVVEVPEVKNESSLLRTRSATGLLTDDSELLSHWQLNGYENPAYKFPDNIVRFSHPS